MLKSAVKSIKNRFWFGSHKEMATRDFEDVSQTGECAPKYIRTWGDHSVLHSVLHALDHAFWLHTKLGGFSVVDSSLCPRKLLLDTLHVCMPTFHSYKHYLQSGYVCPWVYSLLTYCVIVHFELQMPMPWITKFDSITSTQAWPPLLQTLAIPLSVLTGSLQHIMIQGCSL